MCRRSSPATMNGSMRIPATVIASIGSSRARGSEQAGTSVTLWSESMGDSRPIDIGDTPACPDFLFHSGPTRYRWTNESKLGPFVIDKSQRDIPEEDVVHAVRGLDADPLTFERVVDRHHGTTPSNTSARRHLPDRKFVGVPNLLQPTREGLRRCDVEGRGGHVAEGLVRPFLVVLGLKSVESRLLRTQRRRWRT